MIVLKILKVIGFFIILMWLKNWILFVLGIGILGLFFIFVGLVLFYVWFL